MSSELTKAKDVVIFPGSLMGGKASQLLKLQEAGYHVPRFRVVPAELSFEITKNQTLEQAIKSIDSYEFSESEQSRIFSSLDADIKFYSVRSSAVGEDGTDYSFAGLFETYLYVSENQILEKIKLVWKSAFSERVQFYRKQNSIESEIKIAVIIQNMIPAEISGVMFGINPVSQNPDEMLISSVYGLGEGLVSGELNADNFYIVDGKIDRTEIANKAQKLGYNEQEKKTAFEDVATNKIEIESLSKLQQGLLITELQKLNAFYDHPQDVEWSFVGDELFILQSRPITNITQRRGTKIIWDNSNIIESYPGVTTPLTFSFIRDMYEVVYYQFSELLGVSPKKLKDNSHTFKNMLGLLRGRVYYNLLSWYQALALVPGYKLNAGFMETMMGVKEKFELSEEDQTTRFAAWYRMILTIVKMIKSLILLPRDTKKFLAFLDLTIAEYKEIPFDKKTAEELIKLYKKFEQILLKQWKPPLVNDFFAMIYFGVFKKLAAKWIGSDNPHLHNDLLSSSNDIISVQPMIQSLLLAKTIRADEKLMGIFSKNTPIEVWNWVDTNPEHDISKRIREYLYKYGERCLGELKLETISYNQAPEKFIKILQSYINNPDAIASLENSNSEKLRNDARSVVKAKLKGKPIKRWIFLYFTGKTRALVSNRENLRFERTRGFGIVREIFTAIGRNFERESVIGNYRDIFYLTKEEIFDYVYGTSIVSDLGTTIETRKALYAKYKEDPHVPERITTYGMVSDQLDFSTRNEKITDGDLSGIACCPGVVQAEVCVIHSPDEVDDLAGRIMVTSSTDPGWVSLFPTASAILVERGSLLSHSAIVARELGIPCIVGISDLLQKLKSGDLVEMDGSTGQIKIIDHE